MDDAFKLAISKVGKAARKQHGGYNRDEVGSRMARVSTSSDDSTTVIN